MGKLLTISRLDIKDRKTNKQTDFIWSLMVEANPSPSSNKGKPQESMASPAQRLSPPNKPAVGTPNSANGSSAKSPSGSQSSANQRR